MRQDKMGQDKTRKMRWWDEMMRWDRGDKMTKDKMGQDKMRQEKWEMMRWDNEMR